MAYTKKQGKVTEFISLAVSMTQELSRARYKDVIYLEEIEARVNIFVLFLIDLTIKYEKS